MKLLRKIALAGFITVAVLPLCGHVRAASTSTTKTKLIYDDELRRANATNLPFRTGLIVVLPRKSPPAPAAATTTGEVSLSAPELGGGESTVVVVSGAGDKACFSCPAAWAAAGNCTSGDSQQQVAFDCVVLGREGSARIQENVVQDGLAPAELQDAMDSGMLNADGTINLLNVFGSGGGGNVTVAPAGEPVDTTFIDVSSNKTVYVAHVQRQDLPTVEDLIPGAGGSGNNDKNKKNSNNSSNNEASNQQTEPSPEDWATVIAPTVCFHCSVAVIAAISAWKLTTKDTSTAVLLCAGAAALATGVLWGVDTTSPQAGFYDAELQRFNFSGTDATSALRDKVEVGLNVSDAYTEMLKTFDNKTFSTEWRNLGVRIVGDIDSAFMDGFAQEWLGVSLVWWRRPEALRVHEQTGWWRRASRWWAALRPGSCRSACRRGLGRWR